MYSSIDREVLQIAPKAPNSTRVDASLSRPERRSLYKVRDACHQCPNRKSSPKQRCAKVYQPRTDVRSTSPALGRRDRPMELLHPWRGYGPNNRRKPSGLGPYSTPSYTSRGDRQHIPAARPFSDRSILSDWTRSHTTWYPVRRNRTSTQCRWWDDRRERPESCRWWDDTRLVRPKDDHACMGYVCSKEIARQVRWMRAFPNQHRGQRHPGARPHSLITGPAARKSIADRTSFLGNPWPNSPSNWPLVAPEKIRQYHPQNAVYSMPALRKCPFPHWISGPPNPLFEERAVREI